MFKPREPVARLQGPEFRQLMALYSENYRRTTLLFDDLLSEHDRMVSRVAGEMPIYLEILERHPYTTVARLTYFLEDNVGRVTPDPDAHLRIYHDARMTEATQCYPGQVSEPLFGSLVPVGDVVDHRWRTNRLLDKWLEFLLQQGHSVATLKPARDSEWPIETPTVSLDLDRLSGKKLVRD